MTKCEICGKEEAAFNYEDAYLCLKHYKAYLKETFIQWIDSKQISQDDEEEDFNGF